MPEQEQNNAKNMTEGESSFPSDFSPGMDNIDKA